MQHRHRPGTGAVDFAYLIAGVGSSFSGATTGLTYGEGELYMTAGAVGSAFFLYAIDPATDAIDAGRLITDGVGSFTVAAIRKRAPGRQRRW